jgi:hypothetical protein
MDELEMMMRFAGAQAKKTYPPALQKSGPERVALKHRVTSRETLATVPGEPIARQFQPANRTISRRVSLASFISIL